MKLLWFDCETTGTDPVKHGIIQIAGIIMVNGQEMERFEFRCKPNPNDEIEEEALAVHGIKREKIATYSDPSKIYAELMLMFSRHVDKFNKQDKFFAAGKNVRFDVEFLNEFFKKNGKPHPKQNCSGDPFFFSWVHHPVFEVEMLALLYELRTGEHPFTDYKLSTLCEAMGVNLSKAHNAMADIDATRTLAKVFWQKIINHE